MVTDRYSQYRQVQTETASPGQLVLMLYSGARRFLRTADEALEAGDPQTAHVALTRSQDIIFELISSLDTSVGELAENLLSLYVYLYQRLVVANLRKEREPIVEALEILARLDGAWQQVLRQADAAGDGTYGRVHGDGPGGLRALSA